MVCYPGKRIYYTFLLMPCIMANIIFIYQYHPEQPVLMQLVYLLINASLAGIICFYAMVYICRRIIYEQLTRNGKSYLKIARWTGQSAFMCILLILVIFMTLSAFNDPIVLTPVIVLKGLYILLGLTLFFLMVTLLSALISLPKETMFSRSSPMYLPKKQVFTLLGINIIILIVCPVLVNTPQFAVYPVESHNLSHRLVFIQPQYKAGFGKNRQNSLFYQQQSQLCNQVNQVDHQAVKLVLIYTVIPSWVLKSFIDLKEYTVAMIMIDSTISVIGKKNKAEMSDGY